MSNTDRSDSKGQGSGELPVRLSFPAAVLRWFTSSTFRQARGIRKHVHRLLCAQRDILTPQAVGAVNDAIADLDRAIASDADNDELKKQMDGLVKAADKWIKPYPNAAWRENVEVLLVAIAVAMAIRTFFIQPFKIPTGSMEPTLFGVESQSYIHQPDVKFPTGLERFIDWVHGTSYLHVVAQNDGPLQYVQEPVKLLIFSIYQRIAIDNQWQMIWFPPDYGAPPVMDPSMDSLGSPYRADLHPGMEFNKGDDVVKLKLTAGDYLFVDRFTFNFRKPRRGEIIVFATAGISAEQRRGPNWSIPDDQFYIKRLVGLSGESVSIGQDHHLIIDGQRLDASTPRFAKVYSYNPDSSTNLYYGHIPMQRFEDGKVFQVRTNHFLVMGDNTRNSLDSRFFGDVDTDAIIGRASFVYWPLTSRWAFGYR